MTPVIGLAAGHTVGQSPQRGTAVSSEYVTIHYWKATTVLPTLERRRQRGQRVGFVGRKDN